MRTRSLVSFFVVMAALKAAPAFAQTAESITSRFYFPGGIGLNFPTDNDRTKLNKGVLITTALEYRPVYENAWFFRFDYNTLTNHYQNVSQIDLTNVNTGKLSSAMFVLGAGYRKKVGGVKFFALAQPGWIINSFDKVSTEPGVISVAPVSQNHLAFKTTAGLEYYLAPHFALTVEPSYYYWFSGSSQLLNPQSFNMSVGFTTTLF